MAPAEPGTPGTPSARLALRGDLVPHGPDVIGRRADEDEAVLLHHFSEGGVFRQEANARMQASAPVMVAADRMAGTFR